MFLISWGKDWDARYLANKYYKESFKNLYSYNNTSQNFISGAKLIVFICSIYETIMDMLKEWLRILYWAGVGRMPS